MAAYYWMQFYIDLNKTPADEVVNKTISCFIRDNFHYNHSTTEVPLNPGRKHPTKRVNAEIRLNEAVEYCKNDLRKWIAHTRDIIGCPGISFYFKFNFQLSERFREYEEELKEVILSFWYHSSLKDKNLKICVINIDADEFILLNEEKGKNIQNKITLLKLLLNIYEQLHPASGWADSEINSHDRTGILFASEDENPETNYDILPNDIIFIGKDEVKEINKKYLRNSKYKMLDDGGILLVSETVLFEHINY